MSELEQMIAGLTLPDHNAAYECLKQLQARSAASNEVYAYFDLFAQMMDSKHSYIRTRGLLLIAANARWDVDYKIDELIDHYLRHIEDDKPITARQCIQALPELAKHKPELVPDICRALRQANTGRYQPTMQPLVQKDIAGALKRIQAAQQ